MSRREELRQNLLPAEKLLVWEKEISTEEFAEKYVYLPKSNAIGAGQKVNLKYSPHLRKPMQMMDDIYIQEVWLMFASQMAKTLFLFICWAKNAKMNPKTMVWMISKESMIPRYQKEKIKDLIDASPELKTIIEEGLEEQKKSRSKTGIFYHQGTATYIIGSKTSDDKKSVTAQTVIVDEADEMDGLKAIKPLQERSKTFIKIAMKMLVASTKKSKNGTITQGFNSCEQKNYLGMECPHCKELIEVNFSNLKIQEPHEYKSENNLTDEDFTVELIAEKYIPKASKEAYYECNNCQQVITSEQKEKQILDGKIDWIVKGVKEKPRTVGFSANSILSYFVPFEFMAKEYLLALTQKDENKRIEQLQAFYEGYANDYYDPNRKEISDSDDILMLGSGLKRKEITADTKAIFMTIDSQKGHKDPTKDHFWYMVTAVDKKMNLYVIESGKIYDEKKIYEKMHTMYNVGDKKRGIRRVIWDIQGHGELETLAFIQQVNKLIGKIPYTDEENKNFIVYPYRGMTEIQNKTYRLQIEEKTTDNLQDKKYPIIIGNSKRGKDALSKAISRTVKHRKGELECDISNMFFINEDEMEDGAKRLNDKFNKGLKIPAESIEKQLTSEAFGICPYTKSTKETWYPRYDGVPNHLWDCAYMTYIAIEFDGLKERILEN